MQETDFETLRQTSLVMYLALDTLYNLHSEVELEGDEGPVKSCVHCSALADGIVAYPCPSVQVLLTDFTEEPSEPAESEELSS
jgi:hypothetical protein